MFDIAHDLPDARRGQSDLVKSMTVGNLQVEDKQRFDLLKQACGLPVVRSSRKAGVVVGD